MSERPFRVLGLQQIAVGATDKGRLRSLWVDLLGLEAHGNFRSESENVEAVYASLECSSAPRLHAPAQLAPGGVPNAQVVECMTQ